MNGGPDVDKSARQGCGGGAPAKRRIPGSGAIRRNMTRQTHTAGKAGSMRARETPEGAQGAAEGSIMPICGRTDHRFGAPASAPGTMSGLRPFSGTNRQIT
ncbi:hypothetical protein NCCP1664_15180 [Zafaria cholistanensis]|uniref:Uncharacterized protein n=1 Tax=Zafaria cholistanensis TaxID=1682741 RepID=A0A5A7NSC5_9MICC|nr:hypothetical protein NCCP1664_15180 [Zafaria cholistanensis]